MSLRALARRGLLVVLVALSFLAGGLVVPPFVAATVSSGEREAFFPLPPTRILDTRTDQSPLEPGVKLGPGETMDIKVAGNGGVSAAAGAVVLNVTITDATEQSLLTIFPSGTARPTASSLNFVSGEVVPNAVTVRIGANRQVSIYNDRGSVHVVVDVNGYYENVNFDDRYYTESETNAIVTTGLASPDHVSGPQVADGSLTGGDLGDESVTGADVLDGSLSFADLTGSRDYDELTLPNLSIGAKACQVVHVNLDIAEAFKLLVPMRVAAGVIGSATVTAGAVALNLSGDATIQICNGGFALFSTTAPTLDYYTL